ncbi:MAG: 6,7-dimethyl-8-ribityllumazine synthase [Candidatus Neomarinimicrobiota bacterium]
MIGIVVSIFNKPITDGLLKGCIKSLKENGLTDESINIFYVPGAFELPAKVKKLAENNNYDCIIALGCIIKGETDHYHYISQAVTNGIMSVTLEKTETNPHVIFGVLTCQNKELAYARSGDNQKNKGFEAGMAAIHQINS